MNALCIFYGKIRLLPFLLLLVEIDQIEQSRQIILLNKCEAFEARENTYSKLPSIHLGPMRLGSAI